MPMKTPTGFAIVFVEVVVVVVVVRAEWASIVETSMGNLEELREASLQMPTLVRPSQSVW